MSRGEIEAALWGRRSKFNVDLSAKGKEDRTWDGITFDSEHEMEVYRDYVKPNVNIGVFQNLRFQVKFELHVTAPGGMKVKIGTYKADFVAEDRSGRMIVMEAKGRPTPLWKRTQKHVEAEYGLRVMVL